MDSGCRSAAVCHIQEYQIYGEVKGVLDIDSDQLNTFDETDRIYLEKVVDLLIRELYSLQ